LEIPVKALILAGGRSTRMGKDKALMLFGSKTFWQYLVEVAEEAGLEVLISCRKDQENLFRHRLSVIPELFDSIGPMGGILSAMITYPDNAWLVMACDMPEITLATIKTILNERNQTKDATVFQLNNEHIEPLFAIWEPGIQKRMMLSFEEGAYSLKKILEKSNLNIIDVKDNLFAFNNINTPDDYNKLINGK
jgi:molybdopterin-guanine dinucleotide biosynthesis protein A